jgi:hypothetical protein
MSTSSDIANFYLERGEGTGAASKMLSWVTLLILTAAAVQLFKDQHYLPLIAIGLVGWTSFGFVVMVGVFVYCLVTQYWLGVGLLAAYFVTGTLSSYLGKRNITYLMMWNFPMIDPFEGMNGVATLVIPGLFLALALLLGGWIAVVFWTLFALSVLFYLGRCWFRIRHQWGRIHFPLMYRYAGIAGYESAKAKAENREFDFVAAVSQLLESAYGPQRDVPEILGQLAEQMRGFSDRQLIRDTARRRLPRLPASSAESLLDRIASFLQSPNGKKLVIRFAIAHVVESLFGETERGEYLFAVFEGKAT